VRRKGSGILPEPFFNKHFQIASFTTFSRRRPHTAHFIAFFVAHFVVYASSPDFLEIALGQPYLNTKGAFMPALYPIPGFSTHPDHIQTHTIFPHKPGSARYLQNQHESYSYLQIF